MALQYRCPRSQRAHSKNNPRHSPHTQNRSLRTTSSLAAIRHRSGTGQRQRLRGSVKPACLAASLAEVAYPGSSRFQRLGPTLLPAHDVTLTCLGKTMIDGRFRALGADDFEELPAAFKKRRLLMIADTLGAPQAQQIADRFHFILNLLTTMERRAGGGQPATRPAFSRGRVDGFGVAHSRSRECWRSPAAASDTCTSASSAAIGPLRTGCQPLQLRPVAGSHRAHSSYGEDEVRRWLRCGQFPERKPPHRRPPKVNQYADYLQQRWDEGCHNAARPYREIREKGYLGKRAMALVWVAAWRKTGKSAVPRLPRESPQSMPRSS